MELKYKYLISFMTVTIIALGTVSLIAFQITEKAIIENALHQMREELLTKISAINKLHDKAKSDIVLGAQFPDFQHYFQLPETLKGNRYDEKGVIQFTSRQRAIKNRIDEWILFVQSRFPIEETCVIDTMGQEHTRITFGVLAPDEDFSSEENIAPFFEPSFALKEKEVHVQYPYMSSDAKKWVFAYTTPIVMKDGSTPAFLHYEMPISFFQNVTTQNATGRTFVLDPSGRLIADTQQKIDINFRDHHENKTDESDGHVHNFDVPFDEYFPLATTITTSPEFSEILKQLKTGKQGNHSFVDRDTPHYLVYEPLPTFNWSLGLIKSYDQLLTGKTSLNDIKIIIIVVDLALLVLVFILISFLSKRIEQAQIELEQQKEWLHTTLSSIGDAIIATDTKGEIIFMNPIAEKLTGWSLQDVKGRNVESVFHIINAKTRKIVESPVFKVLKKGTIVYLSNHTTLIAKDGSEIPIEDSGAPIKGMNHEMIGVVLVFRDISDRKKTEAQLIQSAKMASLGEMATGMAHELNQPLANIRLRSEVLLEDWKEELGESPVPKLQEILKMVSRASNIINHLRSFGRDTSNSKFKIFPVNRIIEDSFTLTYQQLKMKGISVNQELSDDQMDLNCNPIQIEQILTNLINNAKDAMEDSDEKQLTIRTFLKKPWVFIEVEDTGTGIVEQTIEKIFDPFFTTKTVGKGTGLGLSISYGIIKNHNGTIRATNSQRGGAIFTITLPVVEHRLN